MVAARLKAEGNVLLCMAPPAAAGVVNVTIALNGYDFTPPEGGLPYTYECSSYADAWGCVRDPACAACFPDGTALLAHRAKPEVCPRTEAGPACDDQ